MNILNMFKNFLEELAFLCRETFKKLLQPVAFLKALLFHRYFSAIFRSFLKFFQSSISACHSGTIQIHACFNTPNERRRFSTQQLVVTLIPPVVVK